jgi:hypothetical protein
MDLLGVLSSTPWVSNACRNGGVTGRTPDVRDRAPVGSADELPVRIPCRLARRDPLTATAVKTRRPDWRIAMGIDLVLRHVSDSQYTGQTRAPIPETPCDEPAHDSGRVSEACRSEHRSGS